MLTLHFFNMLLPSLAHFKTLGYIAVKYCLKFAVGTVAEEEKAAKKVRAVVPNLEQHNTHIEIIAPSNKRAAFKCATVKFAVIWDTVNVSV